MIEPVDLRTLVINLNEPSHEISIPFVSINRNWNTTNGPSMETAFTGVGVLSKDGFKGFLNGNAARGLQWMQDKKNRGDVTFQLDDDEGDYLTVDLDKIDIDVKPIVKNNQVTFEVDVKFNATVNGFKTKVSGNEIRKKIIQQVKKEILTTYREGLKQDIDIFRLSEKLYRKNVKAWKKYESDGKIPLTEDSISKLTIFVNKVNPGRKTFDETIKE